MAVIKVSVKVTAEAYTVKVTAEAEAYTGGWSNCACTSDHFYTNTCTKTKLCHVLCHALKYVVAPYTYMQ